MSSLQFSSRHVTSRPVPSRPVPSRPVPSRPVPSRPTACHPSPLAYALCSLPVLVVRACVRVCVCRDVLSEQRAKQSQEVQTVALLKSRGVGKVRVMGGPAWTRDPHATNIHATNRINFFPPGARGAARPSSTT